MDPFTIALATFGVQKLRGKSTNRALRDAVFAGGIGQLGGMAGMGGLQAFGQTGANTLAGSTLGQQFGQTSVMQGLGSLFPQMGGAGFAPDPNQLTAAQQAAEASGAVDAGKTVADASKTVAGGAKSSGLGTAGKLALGAGLIPLLGGDEEGKPITEKLNLNYPSVKDIVTKFERAPGEQLQIGETVEERLGSNYQPRFQSGGLAQFNNGALVNRLPSKTVNDENDHSVYRRASNFVIDESGNGNGDEDTMLAQLADGEFVTTANAVLGAGIMAGANPSDAKQMRDKGAKYFYEQQARFKRIFEMLKKAKAA